MRETGTPIHWRYRGNEAQAHTWIGIARKLLAILKNRVELGFNLGMDQQRHDMYDGTIIVVRTWEDHDEVIIDVLGVEKEEEDHFPYLWIGTRVIGLSSGDDNNVGGTPDPYPDCFDTYTFTSDGEKVWIKRGAPELLPYLWEPYQEDAEFPVSVLHVFDSSDGTDNGLVYPLGSLFNDEFPIGPDWNENAFPLDTFDPLDNGSLQTLDTWEFGFNQRGIGYYTKNGAWVTVGPYTYDPRYNLDNEDSLWLTTMVVDPQDREKDYEGKTRAFRAPWRVFPEMEPTAGSIERFGPYPATILSGVYVFKLSAIGNLCGTCHDNGESGDSYLPPAMVEVEVRLGKPPGKVTTRRFRFNLDAFSNYNRDVIPYGWHGFNRDDPPGPGYGPTNHLAGNWWNRGLLIDIKRGRLAEVENYWLQDENGSPLEQYTITPYQGYADYPFVLEPDPSPACDPCGTSQSPSTFIPGYNASFFPYYKLDGRESPDILVGLTARVIALRCNYDADGIWHEDYVQQVQVDNECRNHSRTEPLGNGLSFPAAGTDSTADEVPNQGLPALSGFSLGEQVYIWVTQPGKVTVLKMDDPEVPGEASRMDNTCGGASQHIKYLAAVGIVPEEVDESYEIVDTFNGEDWP